MLNSIPNIKMKQIKKVINIKISKLDNVILLNTFEQQVQPIDFDAFLLPVQDYIFLLRRVQLAFFHLKFQKEPNKLHLS